jgi:hypothetical protein
MYVITRELRDKRTSFEILGYARSKRQARVAMRRIFADRFVPCETMARDRNIYILQGGFWQETYALFKVPNGRMNRGELYNFYRDDGR